jgi:ABC-type nitrate/sulfonate/bicarbonate transport system substrate-binding protein
MGEALRAGRVDAVAVYDPFMGSIAASDGRVLGRPYDAIGARFVNSAWFALKPWVDGHRDAALRFAKVMSQAAEYTNAHYEALIPLISSFSKIAPDTLAKMVRVQVPSSMPPELIQPVIDLSAGYHEIPASFRARAMML